MVEYKLKDTMKEIVNMLKVTYVMTDFPEMTLTKAFLTSHELNLWAASGINVRVIRVDRV